MSERSRTNISFDTKEELEELRMRSTYLGYSSMGAYISDQLDLKTSQFNVADDLKQTKRNIEGTSEDENVQEDNQAVSNNDELTNNEQEDV